MPSTPVFQISYPDGNTVLKPLAQKFKDIADGAEAGMSTALAGSPKLANSDTERGVLFPAPVQGNTVQRPDKGYTEQYYAVYNSTTNPAGRVTAGWYPQFYTGHINSYITPTGQSIASGGSPALITGLSGQDDTNPGVVTQSGTNATWTVNQPGYYGLMANWGSGSGLGVSGRVFGEWRYSGLAAFFRNGQEFGGDRGSSSVEPLYIKTAGETLSFYFFQSGSATTWYFSFTICRLG